ncbi:carbohydrate ABC transporter permease [Paenarthrobacter sp. CM16]|uniref:carbohydrate ABC transporter permease n=1 Tax=Paenarthrobacter sp. CM16 TaxID=2738447 RepID=UPI00155796D5|nr:carbohydrate ABC transporter permease [Paenarthrobacter sp. CM16]NQD89706.1 carbohydrate ABC transporter permease [Paenarthrobacter sp. CM16]
MKSATRIALLTYLATVALVIVLPIAYVAFGAVRPSPAVTGTLLDIIPTGFTWDHVVSAFNRAPLFQQILNSTLVLIAQTGLQVLTSLLAAYAIVFGRFKRPTLILGLYLVTMMIPNEATVVANYLTIRSLGLFDTLLAVFLPFIASAYSIFLLRQSFLSFPTEIVEASRLDGVGPIRFLTRFLIPLTKPTVMAVSLVSAIAAWNGYLWPLLVTESPEARTVQVGVKALFDEADTDIGAGLAGLIIVSIPTIILVLVGQKFLARGITEGAVK